MLASNEIVEVFVVVNVGNRLAQASRLASTFGALSLEGAHDQTIAEQELLIEGS